MVQVASQITSEKVQWSLHLGSSGMLRKSNPLTAYKGGLSTEARFLSLKQRSFHLRLHFSLSASTYIFKLLHQQRFLVTQTKAHTSMNSPAFELNEPRWMEKQFLFMSLQYLASTALPFTLVFTQKVQVT